MATDKYTSLDQIEVDQTQYEMDHLVYTLSHDMRMPFITLRGFVEELSFLFDDLTELIEDVVPHLESEKQERLREIAEELPEIEAFVATSTKQLDTYLQDLLNLSRTGRQVLYHQKLDANRIIDRVLTELDDLVAEVEPIIEVDTLPACFGDKEALLQIFEHIIRNALQYHQLGRKCQIKISVKIENDFAVYEIADNGRGINKTDRRNIFEPFFRVGWHDVPGRGMGLAYARKLVRLHQGTVDCQSKEGVGTTICFTMPLKSMSY